MTAVQGIICALLGYLLGGFSSAITISLLREKTDIRDMGSGNAGATNMLRSYGWGAGLATFFCDAAKGALAAALGLSLCGTPGAVIAGVAAVLGHTYPVYYGFRGGKGISVTAGMMLVLAPLITLPVLALCILVIWLTRTVSLGSLLGNLLMTALAWSFYPRDLWLCLGITLVMCLNFFSHRGNIVRLLRRSENKMNWRELSAASRVEFRLRKK